MVRFIQTIAAKQNPTSALVHLAPSLARVGPRAREDEERQTEQARAGFVA